MLWDNQNIWSSVSNMLQNGSSIRQNMRDVMLNREKLKEEKIEKTKSDLLWYTYKYDDISHNSANSEVSTSSRQMGNYNWIAYMIYNNAIDNWFKDIPEDPQTIYAYYHHEHPENWDAVADAIKDENLNLLDFWVKYWLVPSEEDEEIWFLGKTINSFFSFAPTLWNAVENQWNMWNEVIWSIKDLFDEDNVPDKRDAAILEWVKDNLSYAKFWKPYWMLSSKQKIELVQYARDNEDTVIEQYRANFAKSVAALVLWETDALITSKFPKAKALFSVAWEIPVVKYWPELLSAIIQLWGMWIQILWDEWLDALWLPTTEELLWAEEYSQQLQAAIWTRLALWIGSNKKVQGWTAAWLKSLLKTMRVSELMPYYVAFKELMWEWAYKVGETLGKWYNRAKDKYSNSDGIWWSLWRWTKNTGSWLWNKWVKPTWEYLWKKWVKRAWKTRAWGREQKNKIKEEMLKSNFEWDIWEQIIKPTQEKYWWLDWDMEIPEETNPEMLKNIEKSQQDMSNRMSWWSSERQRQAFTDALNELKKESKRENRTIEDTKKTLDDYKNDIIKWEDKFLNKLRWKINKERVDRVTGNKELGIWDNDSYATEYGFDPFEKGVEKVRKMWKYDVEKWEKPRTSNQASIERMYKKYEAGELTPLEAKQFSRYLWNEFELFKKDASWEARDWVSQREISEIRWWISEIINDIVKEELPEYEMAIKTLDKAYSDAATSSELLVDQIWKLNEEIKKTDYQTELQKEASNEYDFSQNPLGKTLDTLTNSDPLSVTKLNDYWNYYLWMHDRMFSQRWRKWAGIYELLKDIDKIPDIEWELPIFEDEITKSNLEDLLKLEDKISLSKLQYQNALENIFKKLWYDETAAENTAKKIVAEEPLFKWIQDSLINKKTILTEEEIKRLEEQEKNRKKNSIKKWIKKSEKDAWLFSEEK